MKIPEILKVEPPHSSGALASVLDAMAEDGLILEHASRVRPDRDRTLCEITVEIDTAAQGVCTPGVARVGVWLSTLRRRR